MRKRPQWSELSYQKKDPPVVLWYDTDLKNKIPTHHKKNSVSVRCLTWQFSEQRSCDSGSEQSMSDWDLLKMAGRGVVGWPRVYNCLRAWSYASRHVLLMSKTYFLPTKGQTMLNFQFFFVWSHGI